MTVKWSLFLVGLLAASAMAFAETDPMAGLHRNQELPRHCQNSLQGDQVIELSTPSERFFALSLEQETGSPEGGVLILHDAGQTPDWPFLLQQSRTYLPVVGWSTLSIPLPTPQRDATAWQPVADDAAPELVVETDEQWQERVMARIASGVQQLNEQGNFNIAVLGYGSGAYWAGRYLAERMLPEEALGYALILWQAPALRPDLAEYVGQLSIPILDLYMGDDPAQDRAAEQRKAAAARAKHPDYLQIHDATRHGSYGAPAIDRSTRRIWGWLRTHAGGQELPAGG
jgi:dienelactone hydrolase